MFLGFLVVKNVKIGLRMKKTIAIFSIVSVLMLIPTVSTKAAFIVTSPEKVIQGEPLKIVIEKNVGEENAGTPVSILNIKTLLFDGKPIPFFVLDKKPTAFYGIDLAKKPGDYKISLELVDGTTAEKIVTILKREKKDAPLGIPPKLGGNTPSAATNLVSGLVSENDILNKLWTNPRALWTEKFIFPLDNSVVVDAYGYNRQTGQYQIAHKGTDFRATEGTKVKAMNRGVARLVRNFKEYGGTVVVDHGMGLMTFYMHLSKISVKEGYVVERGQEVGKSGETGYALSPHLHLSLRINSTSIDPIKFMEFFK